MTTKVPLKATKVPPLPAVPDDVLQTAGVFVNAQGHRLMTWRWEKQGAVKGVVYLAHGYGGHTQFDWFLPRQPGEVHEVFEGSILASLVGAGYVCLALDHQSMGRSEGLPRCYFDKYDHLAVEAASYVDEVVKSMREKPVFLCGVSMGGCTAVRMAMLKKYAGLVLLAPMLSLELVQQQPAGCCCQNSHLTPFASFLSAMSPTLAIASPARNEAHPLSQQEMDDDPLTYSGSARARVAEQFLTTTTKLLSGGLRELDTPFLTLHADKDTFTDPYGSQALIDMSASKDKTYLRVGKGLDIDEDMWHMLPCEPGRETVFAAILAWLDPRANKVSAIS